MADGSDFNQAKDTYALYYEGVNLDAALVGEIIDERYEGYAYAIVRIGR